MQSKMSTNSTRLCREKTFRIFSKRQIQGTRQAPKTKVPAKQKEPPASEAFKALFSSVSDPLVWAQRGGTERCLRHQTSLLKGMLVRSVILFSGIDFFSQMYLCSYTDGYFPLMSETRRLKGIKES